MALLLAAELSRRHSKELHAHICRLQGAMNPSGERRGARGAGKQEGARRRCTGVILPAGTRPQAALRPAHHPFPPRSPGAVPPSPGALRSTGRGAPAWMHPTLSSADQRARAMTSLAAAAARAPAAPSAPPAAWVGPWAAAWAGLWAASLQPLPRCCTVGWPRQRRRWPRWRRAL